MYRSPGSASPQLLQPYSMKNWEAYNAPTLGYVGSEHWVSCRCPCSLRKSWTGWPSSVPSNPNVSMILWSCSWRCSCYSPSPDDVLCITLGWVYLLVTTTWKSNYTSIFWTQYKRRGSDLHPRAGKHVNTARRGRVGGEFHCWWCYETSCSCEEVERKKILQMLQ